MDFSISAPILLAIWCYKKIISPWLPKACRFTPTCSEYAFLALKRFGFFKGGLLSIWRLLRCQPFCKGGYDPVPEKKLKNGRLTKN